MPVNLQDSVVLITSSDATTPASNFGTGFVVYQDGHTSYVVTCAHVVNAVGDTEKILAAHQPANIVKMEEDIDIAILRVTGIKNLPPLPLQLLGEKGMSFSTVGYQLYDKPRYRIRPLHGVLGEQASVETRDSTYRSKSWDLKIIDDYQLQPGYSGSPVIADSSGYAIGIVTNMEGTGQKGAALSVEAVLHVWNNMPASVFVPTSARRVTTVVPEPSSYQALTTSERRELVKLLWNCRSMRNPKLRDGIVRDLESEFAISIERNRDDDRDDIRHIVETCEYFQNFTPLIESMQDIEQNSPPMQAIETFLKARQG